MKRIVDIGKSIKVISREDVAKALDAVDTGLRVDANGDPISLLAMRQILLEKKEGDTETVDDDKDNQ